jgi:hypothetical protein
MLDTGKAAGQARNWRTFPPCVSQWQALLEAVCEMRHREPSAKAICFSQFVNALDLIEYRLLKANESGAKNGIFFWVLSLCLSRACLGKIIVYIYKWRKNVVFRQPVLLSELLVSYTPKTAACFRVFSRVFALSGEMGTKVGVIKLDGRMSVQQRDRALSAFQGDSSYQLLLMSLKAGGVALNLTAGARIETTVILIVYPPRR